MTTLRVIVDPILAPAPDGVGRYAEELTRALIRTAPPDCVVEGVVSASPASEYAQLQRRLPGLGGLVKSVLARRDLAISWRWGLTWLPGGGMLHSPSLLAPLRRHDRTVNPADQTVVTIHDAAAWTHPESVGAREAVWRRGMAERAERYADAIVVPTHAVAEQVSAHVDVGDRVRVIGGAPSSSLALGDDADERAHGLGLPDHYLVSIGPFPAGNGFEDLVAAMGSKTAPAIPLVLAGADRGLDLATAMARGGVDRSRVRHLGVLDDADLAVVVARATALVHPGIAEGFGLSIVEALHLGTPVVHSDAPALREVAAEAGLTVPINGLGTYAERLALALRTIVEDEALANRLRLLGADRARAFSWTDSAEKVWQLHADL